MNLPIDPNQSSSVDELPPPTPVPSAPKRGHRWPVIIGAVATVAAVAGITLAIDGNNDILHGTAALDSAVKVAPAGEAAGLTAEASPACVDALDKADELIAIAINGIDKGAEALGVAGDGFEAASNFDIAGLEATAGRIDEINDWFVDAKPGAQAARAAYDEAKAACLGA